MEVEKRKMKELGTVGVIGRFKPLHNGGTLMLESICEKADHVKIGIGSCNKYNARSPFTAEESKDMIDAVLAPRFANYSVIYVPDFAQIPEYNDGQKWKEYVLEQYGNLNHFVSGNEYVAGLLREEYDIVHPASLILPENRVRLRATEVRVEMAKNGDWKKLVPEPIAEYLEQNGLVDRFRREFGLEILAKLAYQDYKVPESAEQEKVHTQER